MSLFEDALFDKKVYLKPCGRHVPRFRHGELTHALGSSQLAPVNSGVQEHLYPVKYITDTKQ